MARYGTDTDERGYTFDRKVPRVQGQPSNAEQALSNTLSPESTKTGGVLNEFYNPDTNPAVGTAGIVAERLGQFPKALATQFSEGMDYARHGSRPATPPDNSGSTIAQAMTNRPISPNKNREDTQAQTAVQSQALPAEQAPQKSALDSASTVNDAGDFAIQTNNRQMAPGVTTRSNALSTDAPSQGNSDLINRLGGGRASEQGEAMNTSSGNARYGEHAWDTKPLQGTDTHIGDFGQSARAQQQPQQGAMSNMLMSLYEQAMRPIDTKASLVDMIMQAKQKRMAQENFRQALATQGQIDVANISGQYGNQRQDIAGDYALKGEVLRGDNALAQGTQRGQYALMEGAQRGQQALAQTDLAGQYGLQRQSMANEASQYGDDLRFQSAVMSEQGQNQRSALTQQGQLQEQLHKYDVEQANLKIAEANQGDEAARAMVAPFLKRNKDGVKEYDVESLAMAIRNAQGGDVPAQELAGLGRPASAITNTSLQTARTKGTILGTPAEEGILGFGSRGRTSPSMALPVMKPGTGRIQPNTDSHLGDVTEIARKYKMTPQEFIQHYYSLPDEEQERLYREATGRDDYYDEQPIQRQNTSGA